ncbi:CoA:oxalate CoA-transferase [Aliiroseovarius halocynthiae]|uniref:CoA transferase n=1 Tax=Aliiroseovarius halocynthiae TaxID=985055 RepID=A0A545SVS5_9RHOB|nr:CoA transferase [Aliiroseovarius halocynthiae]TQV69065.1 CoA transferase [Aliiroseovarius halocynthiae]SMR71818.1 CoA:oxalate CoA-transferase [Aliiroseovarius halocynthiae]
MTDTPIEQTYRPPLCDITILDLTHVLAGPYCSMILSDLGAKVIKVEQPGTGDDTRHFPPFRDGHSAYFATINRDKESIALNLKDDGDRAVFERLLAQVDVVMENYRPGVMERLGYGWDDLSERHPHLIYGAVSGFGHTGPDALRPAYDMVVQARGGVMSITGEKNREPVRVGASVGDIVAGMFLGHGLLAALYQREKTGEGQKVDVAMLDSQLAIMEHAIAITGETGIPPEPSGARHPSIAPFETYHTADGLMVIACGNDVLFAKLCEVIGKPQWATLPEFADNLSRCQNVMLLRRRIETVTLAHPREFWLNLLAAEGIPCAPIQNVAEAMEDPQILARNMVKHLPAPDGGAPFAAAGNPIKMDSIDDARQPQAAPLLDENRVAILDWLVQREA